MAEVLMEQTMTHINLTAAELINKAMEGSEGTLSANNAFRALTGSRTGRSTKDRFIVRDEITESAVDWGAINQPISSAKFTALFKKAEHYIANKASFVSHLRVGEDEKHYLPVEVVTELAWHNLFARNLFIRPSEHFAGEKDVWKILNVPGLKTDPEKDGVNSDGTLIINFKTKQVLICGLLYAGEMKKAMFSVMNFLLPEQNVLPMHCAANKGHKNDTALFFGLSGTGKTTLSADTDRLLIGDDEHGWSESGIFNFEGGCYAKCIDLSEEREPLIWNAIRTGTIMENVVLSPATKLPNYTDDSITQNTRAAYPREFITHRSETNFGEHPTAVIFLCCDLYGVLPPVSILTKEQAAYYFLSGYTALVGSTEVGQTEAIKPTFSTCFGAPFFPQHASVYANILLKRLENLETPVYLVNTGWTGGAYSKGGSRFSIPVTRSIISAILSGEVLAAEKENYPGFNVTIPKQLNNVDRSLLNPKLNWVNPSIFAETAKQLIEQFIANFKKFEVSSEIKNAGPRV